MVELFFSSFIVGFSGALMPGPLLAVDIAETPRHGWVTGPIITIGHAIAEVAVVVLLVLGVAALAGDRVLARVIAVVGGLALLLMGVTMIRDVSRNRISYDADSTTRPSRRRLAGMGLTATLSNPYWFLWWATIGLVFLVKSQAHGWSGPVVFYFGHILSDLVWYTVVSIALWRGRKLIMGRGLRYLIGACALFLLYLGGSFLYDGLTGAI